VAFSNWLAAHTPGWPIFLAATTFLSASVPAARARGRGAWVPWLFLITWVAGVLALYVSFGVDQFRRFAPRMWAGQLLALALAVLVPLLIVLGLLALWARRQAPPRWLRGAVVAAVFGAAAMTTAPMLSTWVHEALKHWIALDNR
jgi:hypothetical protein